MLAIIVKTIWPLCSAVCHSSKGHDLQQFVAQHIFVRILDIPQELSNLFWKLIPGGHYSSVETVQTWFGLGYSIDR